MTLGDCAQTGGGVNVSANYDITFPAESPSTPFEVRKKLPFEVQLRKTDRFTLTIGPEAQEVSSWAANLYVADVPPVAEEEGPLRRPWGASLTCNDLSQDSIDGPK